MSVAFWCVFLAGLMPIFTTGLAKAIGARLTGERFDNADPRGWQARQTGLAARAHAAHLNGFEAFPFFAAAVIVAQAQQAPQAIVDALAIAFILLRLAYTAAYLADRPTLRSALWSLALFAAVAIFTSPLWA